MKVFLILSWLIFAGAGYTGYHFYQRAMDDQQAARVALEQSGTLVHSLQDQVTQLTGELDEEKKKVAFAGTVAAPDASSVSPVAPLSAPPSADNFPATITTRAGKVYEGCKLDRAYPDGLSIIYSGGSARIPFTDLDPAFATSFGYNAEAAQKYQEDEAARMAQSDAARSAWVAQQSQKMQAAEVAQANDPSAVAKPKKTPEEIQSIQAQMKALQDDVSFMQGQEKKLVLNGRVLRTDGGEVTQGAYAGKIADEQARIKTLQSELNQ